VHGGTRELQGACISRAARPNLNSGRPESTASTNVIDVSRSDNTERIIVSIAAQQKLRPHLVVLAGPEVGKIFRLSHPETTIGRSPDADVWFSSPSVSRMHAVARVLDNRVIIQDLSSKNGVFVGVEKIAAPREIHDGDEITIGNTILLKLTYSAGLEGALRHAGYEAASRDPVTQAVSVTRFVDSLRSEHAFARRHNQPLVIAIVRADGIADVASPEEVDDVMRVVASVARDTIRTEDLLARITSHELAVLLRAQPDQAHAMAERVRLRVRGECEGLSRVFAPATVTVAIVPLAPWTGLVPETLLVAARNESRRVMGDRTDTVILLPLLEFV
jgi:pSer/pThr/pTyr-binding forkhead associated (FHA) protein